MAVQGYDNLRLSSSISTEARPKAFLPRTYKGFSSVSAETNNGSLYDLALIKQDLINHFHIRKGEKLENPEFGTIIWDMLFEPLTEQVKEIIVNDVTDIINNDPRTKAVQTTVTQVEYGLQIEATLVYVPYNIQETLQFGFDSRNMIV
jgi:phage baseplate assembly protein W